MAIKKSKKKSVRSGMKRPELNPKMNLKGRQDYMDVDYVDGVFDNNGNELMRGLTDKEKDWLAQFYKEWLNADKTKSKLYKKKDQWKEIYSENNARNRCLLNRSKKMGKLDSYNTKDSDKKFVKEIGDLDLELQVLSGEKDKDDN